MLPCDSRLPSSPVIFGLYVDSLRGLSFLHSALRVLLEGFFPLDLRTPNGVRFDSGLALRGQNATRLF